MTTPGDTPPPPPADARSDRELMAAHDSGDHAAFPELVRRHRDRLWNLALRMLRDREDAADALQDGFVRAFRSAATYRGQAEVFTWLHRIVANVCLDRIDTRRRTPAVSLDDDVNSTRSDRLVDSRDAYAEADARRAAGELLARLPVEQRLPIVLVDVEGYTVAETAATLGIAEGTVKSRCARGRAVLAAALTADRRRDQQQRPTGESR